MFPCLLSRMLSGKRSPGPLKVLKIMGNWLNVPVLAVPNAFGKEVTGSIESS